MEGDKENGASPPGERFRWKFVFAIGGDLRFISHHDTLRLFRRALARADIPVRFTEGYNPHPRIMIPLPRPVGIASRAEALVIETERFIDSDHALQRLNEHTPENIQVISVRRLDRQERIVAESGRYRLDLGESAPTDLAERVRTILDSPVVQIQRAIPRSTQTKRVDIRPFIASLSVDGSIVEFDLRVMDGRSCKPAEIATLLGCDAGSINHRIERMEVQWRQS